MAQFMESDTYRARIPENFLFDECFPVQVFSVKDIIGKTPVRQGSSPVTLKFRVVSDVAVKNNYPAAGLVQCNLNAVWYFFNIFSDEFYQFRLGVSGTYFICHLGILLRCRRMGIKHA